MSDDDTIMAAQARLQQRRAALGITERPPAQLAADAAFRRKRAERDDESLAAVLSRASMMKLFIPPPEDVRYARALARNDAGIPDRFSGVRWENLGGLRKDSGEASLAGVILDGGAKLTGERAVAYLRRTLTTAPKVVLVGRTRSGKSLTAAAHLDGLLRSGAERPVWATAETLGEPGAIGRALAGKTLVLDGIGEELHMAAPGTGLNADRCVPVAALVGQLARLQGKALVVTTYMGLEEMAAHYGGNVAARVFEKPVTVVRIG